jgi:hypothetical protein
VDPLWAENFISERQLSGILNLDDGLQAATSPVRPATLGPEPTCVASNSLPLQAMFDSQRSTACGNQGPRSILPWARHHAADTI